MQKTAQAWFMGGPSSSELQKSPSLLADWNAYASAKAGESGDSMDLEAAAPTSFAPIIKTANDSFMGTFNIVSKGVRDLPGNIQSATSTMPSGKSIMYFGLLLATGIFFIFIAFTMFLPIMVVMPQKFAICFTLGCIFIIGSFFALKGPRNQFAHMTSKERLPFTAGFLGSMAATIYVSMVLHSYILSVIFSGIQVLALSYYVISYFPGGSSGMRFLSSTLMSTVSKCFGR
uniref:Vesicle transport protein n=1 Tax=Araucaria cunninghamii TaxID=56994 RepID=A0A0D6QTK1_ARACU